MTFFVHESFFRCHKLERQSICPSSFLSYVPKYEKRSKKTQSLYLTPSCVNAEEGILCAVKSNKNPLTSSLDEFIEEHSNVVEHEAADVEAKELGGVTNAELETDLCLVGVSKAWIFDLTSNLIYFFFLS